MTASSESPLVRAQAYRAARRAFIAACEVAHVDTIARLHPAKPADGKPLFMDSAALGPRLATRALMMIATDVAGSAIAIALLEDGIALPPDTRLVLVHALDPAAFAGAEIDPDWPGAMLGAVTAEDLSRVRDLAALPLGDADAGHRAALALQTAVTILPPAASLAEVRAAITGFFGG